MSTTILKTTAAPVWGPSARTRALGMSPMTTVQGSALPFAGYAVPKTALATDKQAAAAVRHGDVRVPDPRERKR